MAKTKTMSSEYLVEEKIVHRILRRTHDSLQNIASSKSVSYIQGVPVLVCQTKLGDRDHRSKKILSKDPCPEMNRLASRRM